MTTSRIETNKAFATPGYGPAGLAWDGETLWHADYRDGRVFGLDIATGHIIRSLYCPGNLSGTTWDGRILWQSLFDQEMIRGIDTLSNDFDETILLSGYGWLSGLGWDGRNIWAVAQQRGLLLQVERLNNRIRSSFPVPVAMGDIDYHDGVLWASIATPMRYDEGLGRFELVGEALDYALIAIDPSNGGNLVRYPADRLYSGVCWVGDELWLAHSGSREIFRGKLL